MTRQSSLTQPTQPLLVLLGIGIAQSDVQAQGTLEVWGDDGLSQTVTGAPAGTGFTQVETGYRFSVALNADGRITAWGNDLAGQVSNAPTGSDFIQVAAGDNHALAIRSDGSLVSWGSQAYGLISGTPPGNDFIQVSAGWKHSIALRADGTIECWGDDGGQWDLGVFYPYGTVNDAPTEAGHKFVAAGDVYSIAITANGSLVSWGHDFGGGPALVPGGIGFVEVSCEMDHALARRTDGTLRCWGYAPTMNHFGLASGTPGGGGFTKVATTSGTGIALQPDGTIVAWGQKNGVFNALVTDAPNGPGIVDISFAGFHAAAILGSTEWTSYCLGDGTGAACPCANSGAIGQGCANSTGRGAQLLASGLPSFSADTFQLHATSTPASTLGLILRGDNVVSIPAGDGLLCTSGASQRSQVQLTASGVTTFNDFLGSRFGATAKHGSPTHYQFWYRDAAGTCSGARFNSSNALSVTFAQ